MKINEFKKIANKLNQTKIVYVIRDRKVHSLIDYSPIAYIYENTKEIPNKLKFENSTVKETIEEIQKWENIKKGII